MRNELVFTAVFTMLFSVSLAQSIPKCILQLNNQTKLTTTKFEKALSLSNNRTVYEVSVKSFQQCIHCERGTVYYDANCNMVAYFMSTRGPSGFVADGYTAADFGKSNFRNIRYGVKVDSVSACMSNVIGNQDSLKQAGVKKIVQVRIKEKLLYSVEHKVDPKLANCKDCSRSIVYYNEDCKPEVTFRIGGIAGIQGEKGYLASDYINRRVLKILWNAN